MWKKMALEGLGETNLLPSPKTVVLYDKWFSSKRYREEISEKLGLIHTDKRLNVVLKIGVGRSWGSSFDQMKKKNEAQSMDFLTRWVDVENDESFQKLQKATELLEIAKEFRWE